MWAEAKFFGTLTNIGSSESASISIKSPSEFLITKMIQEKIN